MTILITQAAKQINHQYIMVSFSIKNVPSISQSNIMRIGCRYYFKKWNIQNCSDNYDSQYRKRRHRHGYQVYINYDDNSALSEQTDS